MGIQQIIMPYISAHDFKTRYDIWVWLDFGFTLHMCATEFFLISFSESDSKWIGCPSDRTTERYRCIDKGN